MLCDSLLFQARKIDCDVGNAKKVVSTNQLALNFPDLDFLIYPVSQHYEAWHHRRSPRTCS